MDDFKHRMESIEERLGQTSTSLAVHLGVCEQLQKAANVKMNWLLGGIILILLMTLLGPRSGILEMLSRIHP